MEKVLNPESLFVIGCYMCLLFFLGFEFIFQTKLLGMLEQDDCNPSYISAESAVSYRATSLVRWVLIALAFLSSNKKVGEYIPEIIFLLAAGLVTGFGLYFLWDTNRKVEETGASKEPNNTTERFYVELLKDVVVNDEVRFRATDKIIVTNFDKDRYESVDRDGSGNGTVFSKELARFESNISQE